MKTFHLPDVKGFEINYYLHKNNSLNPPKVFPPHTHDMLEIYFHISGDASFMVGDEIYKLSPGECIVSRPNEVHNCILNTTSEHSHACAWINSPSGFGISEFLSEKYDNNHRIVLSPENWGKTLQLLETLDNSSDELVLLGATINILSIFKTCARSHTQTAPVPEILSTIIADINENFREIQFVEDILHKYYISKSTLSRLFRKFLQTSPKIYLETKKLAYSRILLKRGENVQDACFMSGFSDYSGYIRTFKKHFGITPGKYKQKDVVSV